MIIQENQYETVKENIISDLCKYSIILLDMSIKLNSFDNLKDTSNKLLDIGQEIIDFVSNYNNKDCSDNMVNVKISDIHKLNDDDIEKINTYKEKLLNIINNSRKENNG
jgi:hypothetical protein